MQATGQVRAATCRQWSISARIKDELNRYVAVQLRKYDKLTLVPFNLNMQITNSQKQPAGSEVAQKNISAIASIEHEALKRRTAGERFGDAVATSAGKLWFIAVHALWFAGWIAANCGIIRGVRAFDPFPFQFLTFVTSLESIFLALFILMSQNRAGRQAEAREHLNLQIDLLSEQESTKILELVQTLCRHHGLAEARDQELLDLQHRTEPENLLRELKENLPEG